MWVNNTLYGFKGLSKKLLETYWWSKAIIYSFIRGI